MVGGGVAAAVQPDRPLGGVVIDPVQLVQGAVLPRFRLVAQQRVDQPQVVMGGGILGIQPQGLPEPLA